MLFKALRAHASIQAHNAWNPNRNHIFEYVYRMVAVSTLLILMQALRIAQLLLVLAVTSLISLIVLVDEPFFSKYAPALKFIFITVNGSILLFVLTYVFNIKDIHHRVGFFYLRLLQNRVYLGWSNTCLALILLAGTYYLSEFKWVELRTEHYPIAIIITEADNLNNWRPVGEATTQVPLKTKLRTGHYLVSYTEKESQLTNTRELEISGGFRSMWTRKTVNQLP